MVNKSIIISLLFFIFNYSPVTSFPFQKNCANYIQVNDTISGTYILESCENSRFKIKINKIDDKYFYSIYDRKKIISRGKVKIKKENNSTSFMFGLIGGINEGKNITIQNYGNAMNEFIHFTQCDEKYLTFVKKS